MEIGSRRLCARDMFWQYNRLTLYPGNVHLWWLLRPMVDVLASSVPRLCYPRLTSLMLHPHLKGGKVQRNWIRRRAFSNKSCESLGLRGRSCRCSQVQSSRCMSLPLLRG